MGRDDLYITVPSFFRCPISLDVMKSPVSLCTGVTYDRASIQRWLDDGNNTCPATMQVLSSKDFVPNRTLHRLIQIWSESVRLRKARFEIDNSSNSKDQVVELIQQMHRHTSSSSVDSLAKILRFAKESEDNRKFLANCDGFAALLVEALAGGGNAADGSNNIRILEQIVRIIHFLIGEIQDSDELVRLMLKKSGAGAGDCLASLLLVLQRGSAESRIASARVMESIAVSAESKLLVAERDGVLPELLKLTSPEKDSTLIEAGLSCLIAVSVPKRVKVKLVQLGAVRSLSKLLSDSNSTTSTIEKVLKLLETVSSVKEGRAKICEAEEEEGGDCCVSAIVQRLLKASSTATEHAVMILWSVCYLFKERSAQEAVTKANGLTKILLLMQSNCSPCVRPMAADLLKIFRVNSKSTISCYDTKTTHIMPF
ncbi:putative aminoacyltransferase, E1 ubiquitin-activating enzyme [Rosa chinensis]|uniref:U-box domain-containing protein n=1 Tax=Rosa chinensis TaxID=74649 RepID=A0A2P6RS67_ROSCH|nr:U-box domain-containing protein 28 [Rosa chinensis]PRQ49278.1 putative aminoacyltransferase, E1 ubiquitin-activating enzyme [Rosa chinensis]